MIRSCPGMPSWKRCWPNLLNTKQMRSSFLRLPRSSGAVRPPLTAGTHVILPDQRLRIAATAETRVEGKEVPRNIAVITHPGTRLHRDYTWKLTTTVDNLRGPTKTMFVINANVRTAAGGLEGAHLAEGQDGR
mmetsp:Transcript_8029/g.14907  ORF Transcript_8029/g.14907 Transcript_8029/m.14907 type:complete len:133 (-) Transcript_8029:29-427(-)